MKYIFFFFSLLVFSCSQPEGKKKTFVAYTEYTDDLHRKVNIKQNATRFLSLAPSITEILFAVCDSAQIVGRTPYCNFPAAALSKPLVNNYPVDFEKILFLKPDLVFVKDGMISLDQAAKIEEMGIPVYFQKYDSVKDIFTGIERIGLLTGNTGKAKKLADSLRTALDILVAKDTAVRKMKVLLPASKESYFVFGKNTYASDILRLAGLENAIDSVFSNPYPQVSAEYLLKINPDIMIASAGIGLKKDFFVLHPELKKTNAYKNKRLYLIDDDLISRPGPRVVEAISIIKKQIKN